MSEIKIEMGIDRGGVRFNKKRALYIRSPVTHCVIVNCRFIISVVNNG